MRKILIILLCSVSFTVFSQNVYYVQDTSMNANASDANAGTNIALPFATWQKGFETAVAGDTVYFRGGVWYPDTVYYENYICAIDVRGGKGHTGTPNNRIYFFAYPGESPILDCKNVYAPPPNPNGDGNRYLSALNIRDAHWLHFKGLTVRNVYQREENVRAQGITSSVISNLIFEQITVHNIGGEGWYIYNLTNYRELIRGWDDVTYGYIPYDTTRFINCDTYQVCDTLPANIGNTPGNMADGFKFIIQDFTESDTLFNVYYMTGCRSWRCADDGFDLPGRGRKYIDNCWTFLNKYPGFPASFEGDGFKIAGSNIIWTDPLRPSTVMTNCFAAWCSYGFFDVEYENYYRNNSRIYNNTFYKNTVGIQISDNNDYPDSESLYRNNIIYGTTGDQPGPWPSNLEVVCFYRESNNTWDYADDAIIGSLSHWMPTDTVTVTDDDFLLTASTPSDSAIAVAQLMAPRGADGSLPPLTFMKLASGSDLIDAGIAIPATDSSDVTISYNGAAPDIGFAEYSVSVPAVSSASVSLIKSIQALISGDVISDGDATITARGIVWGTSANPTLSNNVVTVSGTTGAYTTTLTGLTGNTTYHVRSYATNSAGTSYGSDVSFTTAEYTPIMNGSMILVAPDGKIIVIK